MSNTIVGRTSKVMDIRTDGAVSTHLQEEKEAFSWTTVSVNPTTADTILLVTNDSDKKHLHIVNCYLYCDIPTAIDFFLPAYATFTGTAVTGIALNRSAVSVAPATALGITSGDTLANIFATLYTNELTSALFPIRLQLDGLLVLDYHDSVGIAIVGLAGLCNAAIMGYYHDNH